MGQQRLPAPLPADQISLDNSPDVLHSAVCNCTTLLMRKITVYEHIGKQEQARDVSDEVTAGTN